MIRAGVPQSVAMSITGHETDSVFRRYDIVSQEDKIQALRRTEVHLAATPEESNVHEFPERNTDKRRTFRDLTANR